jgi:predicted RND superfamily exporter protein
VDYSIHYLSRLRASMRDGLPFEAAVLETVRYSGKAIASNAFTVGIGFTALLFSVFSPLATMGWMITTTMIVSAVATIILFPAVLKTFPALFFTTDKSTEKLAPSGGLLPEK